MLFSGERRSKLALLSVELEAFGSIVQRMFGAEPNPEWTMVRFNTETLRRLLADVAPLIPADSGIFKRVVDSAVRADETNRWIDMVQSRNRPPSLPQNDASVGRLRMQLHSLESDCSWCNDRIREILMPVAES